MISNNQLMIGDWLLNESDHCYYLIHPCPGLEALRTASWTIPKHKTEFTVCCSNCRKTSPPMLTTYRMLKDAEN
jgi:hypothetical protein